MIRSMTGYGRASGEVTGRGLVLEIKTVNHRFLNFAVRLPPDLQPLELEFQARIKARLQRGQVSVFANWEGDEAGGGSGACVNVEAARKVAEALRVAARAAGVAEEVSLAHLLAFPAVTAPAAGRVEGDRLWAETGPLVDAALQQLDAMRAREGEHLADDVRERLGTIAGLGSSIEARRPAVVEEARARLSRRVQELGADLPPEALSERVSFEVALFADRSDVSEELVRLRSHREKFAAVLGEGGAVGRKLDFLLQEMNREVNTIGSKASDAEVGRLVVEMKSELEKIREQVQNLE
jgi:uncharacterized protein (TIGR00255 family)